MNKHLGKYRAEAFTLLSSLLWGTSFVAVKAGLDYIEPCWFAQIRLLAAGFILAMLARGKVGKYMGDARVWVLALLCSFGFVAQNVGMQWTTSSKAAFYINASIVPVAILSHKFLNETFSVRKIVGVLIAVAGVYLLTTGGKGLTNGSLRGDLIVLATSLSWAVYGVTMKWLLQDPDIRAMPLTAGIFVISGAMVTVPAALLTPFPLRMEREGLLLLVYIILFCTALPNVLWVLGLRKISVTASGAILLVEPIAALVLGMIILKDRFTFMEGVGAFGILLAIGLIARRPPSTEAEEEPESRVVLPSEATKVRAARVVEKGEAVSLKETNL